MPSIVYRDRNGDSETLEVPVGQTLMHAAVSSGVPGIVGECGGSAMCATCHVYIDTEQQIARGMPGIGAVEDAMLDSVVSERRSQSRLSCQLKVTTACEGLVVELPERQV